MQDINFVAVAGRLTRAPKIGAKTATGASLITLTLATNKLVKDVQKSQFHKVLYWTSTEKESEYLKEALVTGTPVHITGEIDSYEHLVSDTKVRSSFIMGKQLTILMHRSAETKSNAPAAMDEAAMEAEAISQFEEDEDVPAPRAPSTSVPVQEVRRSPRDKPAVIPQQRNQAATPMSQPAHVKPVYDF